MQMIYFSKLFQSNKIIKYSLISSFIRLKVESMSFIITNHTGEKFYLTAGHMEIFWLTTSQMNRMHHRQQNWIHHRKQNRTQQLVKRRKASQVQSMVHSVHVKFDMSKQRNVLLAVHKSTQTFNHRTVF